MGKPPLFRYNYWISSHTHMDTQTPLPPQNETLLQWSAPMRSNHERSHRWYVIGGTVVVACAAYGILTGAWTFAVVAVLCAAMYVLLHGHEPEAHTMSIGEAGVTFDGVFTRWEDFAGYWFNITREYTEFRLTRKGRRKTDMLIHLGTLDPNAVREIIGGRLGELADKKESLIDAITRICKL